jgi:hypothetical protein
VDLVAWRPFGLNGGPDLLPHQVVNDAARTLMAAASQGDDDVVFYVPDGKKASLSAGAARQISGRSIQEKAPCDIVL